MNRLLNFLLESTGCAAHRVRKILALSAIAFIVLVGSAITCAWLIYAEVLTTYSENYQTLSSAGFSHLITTPGILDDRVLMWISMIPILGAILVFPLTLLGIVELVRLATDYDKLASAVNHELLILHNFEDADITREIMISERRTSKG